MKKATFLSLLAMALVLPVLADDEVERHQSYLSYDDGGTVVRSGEDGSEIEAHRNLPIYPGDEIITSRRGRAEVRLSDGNIIGVDRATALRFRSMLDSYEGENGETVVELQYGKVAVHRTDIGRDRVRLDTDSASYVASDEAVYSVEADTRGRDRVTVFDGSLEVRTRKRTVRVRTGQSATIDDGGAFELTGDLRNAADDFEKWFLVRAENFGSYNSRHMNRRLSYWSDDLEQHGRWVNLSGIGYSWRPYVSASWRPFHNGYWSNRFGCLTWVSYDPWGWGTDHYGRWAFDQGFGWVWVPGNGYSPAWVYWMYGSGTIGWAPAGWWDCHRSYYSWAYNPYRDHLDYGFGFYGRVRMSDLDLRPWTFIDSRTIVSTRVDRAALTIDAVKQRLGRSRDGFTTVARGPARFTREEWNDPAEVIRRRGIGGAQTGRETGAPPTDMTPFFRRDGDVAGDVRDRVVRSRGTARAGFAPSGTPSRNAGGSGSVAPIGGGSVAPIGRGSVAPIDTRRNGGAPSGRVSRGVRPPPASQPVDSGSSTGSTTGSTRRGIDRPRDGGRPRDTDPPRGTDTPRPAPAWRERGRASDPTPAVTPPSASERPRPGESWRGRVRNDGPSTATPSPADPSATPQAPSTGGSDVPRRVIDRINGPRTRERTPESGSRDRESGSRDRGSSTRDSGRSSSSREGASTRDSGRSSSPRESAPPPPRTESKPDTSSERRDDGGGRVKRE